MSLSRLIFFPWDRQRSRQRKGKRQRKMVNRLMIWALLLKVRLKEMFSQLKKRLQNVLKK